MIESKDVLPENRKETVVVGGLVIENEGTPVDGKDRGGRETQK